MVALLINNGDKEKSYYAARLAGLVDKDNIIQADSIPAAKKFIDTQLVKNGKRIDFIVTNFAFGKELQSAIDLMLWLKDDSEMVYDKASLQLRSLPVVLIHTSSSTTETDKLLGFDNVIYSRDLDNQKRIQYVIEGSIKSWVDRLLADYDLLKLDPRVPFLNGPIVWNYNCEVLAPSYALYPRRLPFLVFERDILAAEAAIAEFYKSVEKISSSPRPKQEKMYHRLLRKYPEFILGETYDKIYYEKNFKLLNDSSRNLEPDFIRRHNLYNYNNIGNVLEIKLPNDKFIAGSKFHPTLSGRLVRNLSQVKDYQEYFQDRLNYEAVTKQLGYFPQMTHSLLLGRSSEKDIHLELLDKRLRQFSSTEYIISNLR